MEFEETMNGLKTLLETRTDTWKRRFGAIEENVKKRRSWAELHDLINKVPGMPDESILREMKARLGDACLRKLVLSVADGFVKELDEKITTDSLDLRMDIKPK